MRNKQPELVIALDAVQCSNYCRHCEVTYESPRRHLTREEICRWRDRVHEAAGRLGVRVSLGLTNTEPLDHPQWREIGSDLGDEGWGRTLATNGRRIAREPDLVHELTAAGVEWFQFTLGGADSETHDAFTRRRGSFEDVMAAGRAVLDAGIHIVWAYIAYRPLSEIARMSEVTHREFGPDVDESPRLVKPQGQGWNMEHLRPTKAELRDLPGHLRDRFPTSFGAGCDTEGEVVCALREGRRAVGCIERETPSGCDPTCLVLCRNGDLYPLCHERTPDYLLGNLLQDGLANPVERLRGEGGNDPPRGVAVRRRGLAELAAQYGDPDSDKLHSGCSLCRTLVRRALEYGAPPAASSGRREPSSSG